MERTRTKKCKDCGERFPATHNFFNKRCDSKDGLFHKCRACSSKHQYKRRNKDWRERNESIPREEWRSITGYEGLYEVSNFGRVARIKLYGRRICAQTKHPHGYVWVNLSKDNIKKSYRYHPLVAREFLGPCPDGMQINHKDGNKANNHISNLEYVTPSENCKHAYRIGLADERGERNPNHKLKEKDIPQIRKLLDEGVLSQREIGRRYGVTRGAIKCIKIGRNWGWLK